MHRAVSTIAAVEELYIRKYKVPYNKQKGWERLATDEIMTNLQLKIQRLARIENNSKANAALTNQNDAEHDKSILDEESSNE